MKKDTTQNCEKFFKFQVINENFIGMDSFMQYMHLTYANRSGKIGPIIRLAIQLTMNKCKEELSYEEAFCACARDCDDDDLLHGDG
ncbi:MAG: hypothetical protein IJ381_01855 [Clostridia bacterium]|nr:hypothetical protein [Clostridia bacterium]